MGLLYSVPTQSRWQQPGLVGNQNCRNYIAGTDEPSLLLSGGTDKKPPRARGYAEDDIVGGTCGEGGKAGPWGLKAGSNGAVRYHKKSKLGRAGVMIVGRNAL